MAAPTTQRTGLNYVLYTVDPDSTTTPGGRPIGGGTDATLTQDHALQTATNKDNAGWQSYICGQKSWQITTEGMYLESAAEVCGDTLDARVGSASGVGGSSLKGIKNISIELTAEMIGSANSTTGTVREVIPGERGMSVTITGDWYDPGFDTAFATLSNYVDGTSPGNIEITFEWGAAQQVYADFRVTNIEITFPVSDLMQYTITLESDGAIAAANFTTTNVDSGLKDVIDAMFATAGVTSLSIWLSTDVVDEWEFSGTVYPERLSIELPYEGGVTYGATFAGSGALTDVAGDA